MMQRAQRQTGLAVGLCLNILLGLPAPLPAGWRCDSAQPDCRSVFIVRNWWHAAIVLRRSDIPEAMMPELNELPVAHMIEFSWGDRDYFPDPDAGVFTALKAAFWSSGSVLHLVAFDGAAESLLRDASSRNCDYPTKPSRACSFFSMRLLIAPTGCPAPQLIRASIPTVVFMMPPENSVFYEAVTPGLPKRSKAPDCRSIRAPS